MDPSQKEQWMQLCEQAAQEQNSEKLRVLVRQITQLLDEKQRHLQEAKTRKTE